MSQQPQKDFHSLLFTVILPYVEYISIGILLLAGVFGMFALEGYHELLTVSLQSLAVAYFLRGFDKKGNDGFINKLIFKVGYIACAITLVGVLFSELSLDGAAEMLKIGSIAMVLTTVASVVKLTSSHDQQYKPILTRFFIVFVILILSYLF